MENYRQVIIFGKKRSRYYNHATIENHTNNDSIIPSHFKILIIDDDIDFLAALEYRLTETKIDVIAVKRGLF